MDEVQIILEALILLGIVYVAFIQDRVTKVKNSLLDTLKDYPKAANAFLKMERSKVEKEIKDELSKKMKKETEHLKKFHENVTAKLMKDEMTQMAVLLTHLFLDLKLQPYNKEEYIAKMKDGISKEIAKRAFEVAKEIP